MKICLWLWVGVLCLVVARSGGAVTPEQGEVLVGLVGAAQREQAGVDEDCDQPRWGSDFTRNPFADMTPAEYEAMFGAQVPAETIEVRPHWTQTRDRSYQTVPFETASGVVSMSVLTMEEAQDAFCDMVANVDQMERSAEICLYRTYQNARFLENKRGIYSAQIRLEQTWGDWWNGRLLRPAVPGYRGRPPEWEYHHTNVVLIQTQEGPQPYMFDAVLFPEGPVPVDTWQRRAIENGESTSQFEYRRVTTLDNASYMYTVAPDDDLEARRQMQEAYDNFRKDLLPVLTPRAEDHCEREYRDS